MSYSDTSVKQLVINSLTKEEYAAMVNAGTISSNELYMITDDSYPSISELANVATSGEYNDLINKPTVDQTYNATSTNAQSGTAIANVLNGYQESLTNGIGINISNNTISVTEPVLTNYSNIQGSLTVLGTPTTGQESSNVGPGSNAINYATALGSYSNASGIGSTALGRRSTASGINSLAIGTSAQATATGAIALGTQCRNNEAKTFKVALTDSNDFNPAVNEATGLFTLLQSNGKIPNGRLDIDSTPTQSSTNAVTSGGVYSSLNGYQPLINSSNKLDSANISNLANVATSGEYSDLVNIPSNIQTTSNMVDTISNTSTNTTYPTASAVYNAIGNIEAILHQLNSGS